MGLIAYIKQKWNDWYYHDLDDGDLDDWEEKEEKKEAYFHDPDQRTVYVLEALGQMAESSEKMEQCSDEYEAVTSLLMDMEEIENLPNDVRTEIMDQAQKIETLEKERRRIYNKSGQLPESTIQLMERLEEEIPGGIRKMQEAEDYRRLVKQDLKKLSGERNAFHFRKRDLKMTIANSRGIAAICGTATVLCIIILLVLQSSYGMDVRIGYLIAGGAGAITLTVLYIRYLDAVAELKKLAKSINKLISLHNTVKIRYVNNTNLLSYLYMKYDVEDSKELEERWNIYMDEIGARQKDEKLRADLEYYYGKLTKTLRKNKIKDPDIWTRQAAALYDQREMVEVRHALIGRRQKLREQMEYNKEIAVKAQERIKELGRKYPQYSSEIADIVNRYDKL